MKVIEVTGIRWTFDMSLVLSGIFLLFWLVLLADCYRSAITRSET
jgi:hypothetical protein